MKALRRAHLVERYLSTRMRSVGANMGATRANDFPHQADKHGQVAGNHPRSRTDLDDAERDAGNYGIRRLEVQAF
jgi:hypothetical protein